MILCSSCGKQIEKVPTWLQGTQVDFVCNNCPNRQTKNIAFVTLEVEQKGVTQMDDDEEVDVEDLADAEI